MPWLLLLNLIAANLRFSVADVDHPYKIQELPDDSWYWRRAYHASTRLGDSIVITGGEGTLNPYDNGTLLTGLLEITILIDMRKSWTNASVPYIVADGNGMGLAREILWPANDNKTCYSFGGSSTSIWDVWESPPVSMWQFAVNSSGGGSWDPFDPKGSSGWKTIMRPDKAAGTTLENTGYIIGGEANDHSSLETMDLGGSAFPLGGIASFNMTTKQWSNDTAPANVTNVFLEAVTGFGPAGLLVSAGFGNESKIPDIVTSVSIYEPIGKSWHIQSTTGEAPKTREWACTTGLRGDNGTYEIFMYGGRFPHSDGNLTNAQVLGNTNLDEVWTRERHTCEIVGNRQMLSIGGMDPNDANAGQITKDPMAQGLQIFDLTRMVWTSGYDANAPPYRSPQVVRDWYAANGSSTKFDEPAVQGFFSATTTPGLSSSSHSPSQGAIAGGVVGGIVLLAIISLLVWFLLRRRRRGRYQKPAERRLSGHSISDGSSSAELEDKKRLYELHGRHDGHKRPEMESKPASRGPFEMGESPEG